MSFFDSEIVKGELKSIETLQRQLTRSVLRLPIMSKAEKMEHVELLSELLEKQRILYTRVSLSDDPDAIQLKQRIIESSRLLGYGDSTNMSVIFDNMNKVIDRIRREAEVDK
jgi:hypothetical protein